MTGRLYPYTPAEAPKLLTIEDLWNLQQINVASFWQHTKGAGVVVAVIDTGLDVNHPDFAGRIINPVNLTYEPGGVQDNEGHGTHVAGIIAGAKTGVAPEARIMPIKVFGSGDGFQFQEAFRVIKEWNAKAAEADKVRVINCSWGGAYDAVINYHIRELMGGLVETVAAAGNAGDGQADTSEIYNQCPGFLWEPVTTGATDEAGNPTGFSSSFAGIDIGAPGNNIYSTFPGGGYKVMSGTSMSAPHIAGALALIYAWTLLREGRVPSQEYIESTLFKHVKKTGADPDLVGNGVLDLTWDLRRWPAHRVQLGAFYEKLGAVNTQAAITPTALALKLGTPILKQY